MSAPTRRDLLVGTGLAVGAGVAARGAVFPGLAAGADLPATTPKATQVTVRRGRAIAVSPRGDRTVVAHDRARTIEVRGPRGRVRLIDVGGQPLEVAIAPSGKLAAVTTASWDHPGLILVDLRTGAVRARVDVGDAPSFVAFTRDGRRILVTGGEQEGRIWIVDARTSTLLTSRPIGLVPRGIAIAGPAPAALAWVALNADSRLVGVDTRTGRVVRVQQTGRLPDHVAASRSGRRLLVTHGGRTADHVSEVDLQTRRTRTRAAGRLPSAVAWTARGQRLVALGGDAAVVVLGARGGPRRLRASGAPRGLAVAGSRAWTVDGLTGAVRRVKP
ncbi:hypothetical protein DSM112329_02089 [Paraconexibacter sp. AEG42_29]|uniref:WD40 repeat domain-containing protein n=1 Tax=Paraconexibacter sp. AEG42_29 TaxID=2997339 RepID=A0AAU7AUB4_9ACTN